MTNVIFCIFAGNSTQKMIQVSRKKLNLSFRRGVQLIEESLVRILADWIAPLQDSPHIR
jgi:hypothetical protein